MERDPRTVLYIGRFQPYHIGHLNVTKELHERFARVVVAIGSAQESHSRQNPFTAGERYEMIRNTLKTEGLSDVEVLPIHDTPTNAMWVAHMRAMLPRFHIVAGYNPLVNTLLEEAGYRIYAVDAKFRDTYSGLSVRSDMMQSDAWHHHVHPEVVKVIDACKGVDRLRRLSGTDKDEIARWRPGHEKVDADYKIPMSPPQNLPKSL